MKKIPTRSLLPLLCAGLALTGCIDDKYDLSDVDTTVKVQVENLVVPINIDNATLSNMFDLPDDSKVKDYDGQYAFIDDGDFDSDDISIHAIHLDAPQISPIVKNVNFTGLATAAHRVAADAFRFPLEDMTTNFHTESYDVSSSIISLSHVAADFTLDISMHMPDLAGLLNSFTVENLVMQFPAGLEIDAANATYDAATGLLTVGTLRAVGNTVSLVIPVNGIDPTVAGVVYTPDDNHVVFRGEFAIDGGTLCIDSSDLKTGAMVNMPSNFDFITEFVMSNIDVTSFSGRIQYNIDGANFSDVTLTDLPDILNQSGTDIRISNPQIYVKLNNPMHTYSLTARTGLEITSYKDGSEVGNYALDAPGYFDIAGIPSQSEYSFCLSPATPAKYYPGYGTPAHVGYKALSNVLSGDGIPSRLHVFFDSPSIPAQDVVNFPLGVSLGHVKGTYTFFAPLAFADGSTIVYTDKLDGWSSEDLDHLTIQSLDITATLSTDIPVALNFTGYPINKQGEQINGVEIEGARLEANAKDQELNIHITGAINGLDGIRFTATAIADDSSAALSPDMTIEIKNVRPRVSGYYEKEL